MPQDAAQLVVRLEAKLDQFERQLKNAGVIADNATKDIEDRFNKANPQMSGFASQAPALGRRLGTLIGAALVAEIYKEFANLKVLDDLGKKVQDLRLSAQSITGLQYAGAQQGADKDQINSALDKFTEQSKKTKEDAAELYKALGNISPAFAKAFETAPNQAQRLQAVMSALAATTDEVKRAQVGMQAFGTDNERVLATFSKSGDALSEYAAAARAAGIQIDDALIAKATDAQRKLDALAEVIALKLRVALVDLVPVIQNVANAMPAIIDAASAAASRIFGLGVATSNVLRQQLGQLPATSKETSSDEQLPASVQKLNRLFGTPTSAPPARSAKQRADIEAELASRGEYADPRDLAAQAKLRGLGSEVQGKIGTSGKYEPNGPAFAPRPSLKDKSSGSESADAVESYINSLERSTAALTAEVNAYGLSNEKKQQAIVLAKGEEIAKQRGSALTEEETQRLLTAATAAGMARDKFAQLQQQSQQTAEAMREFGQIGIEAISGLLLEGKSLTDVMGSVVKSLARAALQAAILGSGPLAGLFGTAAPAGATGAASVGGLIGLLGGIGKNAAGTDNWRGGPTWVGENGPEIVNLPRGAQVVPNAVAARGGGGGSVILGDTHIDARGSSMTEGQFRAVLAENNRVQAAQLSAMIRDRRGRGSI